MDVVNKVPRLKLSETVFIRCVEMVHHSYIMLSVLVKNHRDYLLFSNMSLQRLNSELK